MVLLICQHTHVHISMWKPVIYSREGSFQNGILSLNLSGISALGQLEVDLLAILMYQTVLEVLKAFSCTSQCQCYYSLENPLPLGDLKLNAQPSLDISGGLCLSFPLLLVPLVHSMFVAEHATHQFRLQILVASCWMEASWCPTVLNMFEDILCQCPIIKDFVNAVCIKDFVNAVCVAWVVRGLLSLHLPLWLLRHGFSPTVWSGSQGQLQCLQQRFTSNVGKNGQISVLKRVYSNNASHICPKNGKIFALYI